MLSIKLPEIAVRTSGKPVDVYILEGETVFGDRCSGKMLLLSSYPKLGVFACFDKDILHPEKVIKFLQKSGIPYQSELPETKLLDEIEYRYRDSFRWRYLYPRDFLSYLIAFLILLDHAVVDRDTKEEIKTALKRADSSERVEKLRLNFDIKKAILSKKQINLLYFQFLISLYEYITESKTPFHELFTEEEIRELAGRLAFPAFKNCKSETLLNSGWIYLFCRAAEDENTFYEKFFKPFERIVIDTNCFFTPTVSWTTAHCEKAIIKAFCEKKEIVSIHSIYDCHLLRRIRIFDRGRACILTGLLLNHVLYIHETLSSQSRFSGITGGIEIESISPEMLDCLLKNFSSCLLKRLPDSPYIFFLFLLISKHYLPLQVVKDGKLRRILMKHMCGLLSEISPGLLKKQKFRKYDPLWRWLLTLFVNSGADAEDIEFIADDCMMIENFPISVFLFYPSIRKLPLYEKILSKTASSARELSHYMFFHNIIASEPFIPKNYRREYDKITEEVFRKVSPASLKNLLKKGYVPPGVEEKVKLLAALSKENFTYYKQYAMLKKAGLTHGNLATLLDHFLSRNNALYSLYRLLKFTGKVAGITDEKEFDIFARMVDFFAASDFFGHFHISDKKKDIPSFLEDINLETALSLVEKLKKVTEK